MSFGVGSVFRSLVLRVALTAVFVIGLAPHALGAPLLLAKYRFDGNAYDARCNSPPMDLFNTSFVSNTLFMPVNPTNIHYAQARIYGFSYSSFTVALDFNPTSLPVWRRQAILYGGPAYRWIGLEDFDGHLRLTLNNHRLAFDFPEAVIETNRWHTLVCSVDVAAQKVVVFFDHVRQPDIRLQNFQFAVIGTDSEEWDKVFGFTDHSTASAFQGYAENLRVYSRALTADEITALVPPQVHLVQADNTLLVHWSVDWSGFVLQTRKNASTTNVWTTVTNRPVVVGNQYVVVQPITGAKRFYRLSR